MPQLSLPPTSSLTVVPLFVWTVKRNRTGGAPRFNVTTHANATYFFGCSYGVHIPLANGWTHVEFVGGEPNTGPFEVSVASVEVVCDEPGDSYLRVKDIALDNSPKGWAVSGSTRIGRAGRPTLVLLSSLSPVPRSSSSTVATCEARARGGADRSRIGQ